MASRQGARDGHDEPVARSVLNQSLRSHLLTSRQRHEDVPRHRSVRHLEAVLGAHPVQREMRDATIARRHGSRAGGRS